MKVPPLSKNFFSLVEHKTAVSPAYLLPPYRFPKSVLSTGGKKLGSWSQLVASFYSSSESIETPEILKGNLCTVKLGIKELHYKELLAIRNNFKATKNLLIAKFDCTYFANKLNDSSSKNGHNFRSFSKIEVYRKILLTKNVLLIYYVTNFDSKIEIFGWFLFWTMDFWQIQMFPLSMLIFCKNERVEYDRPNILIFLLLSHRINKR